MDQAGGIPVVWQWVGLALAIVGCAGFVLALPPFLQMYLGRPNLKLEFAEGQSEKQDLACLTLLVSHFPSSRKWRFMGISRADTEVMFIFGVHKPDGAAVVLGAYPEVNGHAPQISYAMKPSYFPLVLTLVVKATGTAEAKVMRTNGDWVSIEPGKYFLTLLATDSFGKTYQVRQSLSVGSNGEPAWLIAKSKKMVVTDSGVIVQ